MSTRSSARNLFPPLDNPELIMRRRSRADPTPLNDFEMAAEGNGGTFMKRRPKECYDLIENMTTHHNDWDTSAQRSESSSSITSFSDQEIVALKAKMAEINKNLMKVLQINQQVKAVTPSCETCGGPHSYNDCPATIGQTQNTYAAGAYQGGNSYQPQGKRCHSQNMQTNMTSLTNSNLELKNMFGQFMNMNTASTLGLGTLPSNTITNPEENLKGITTRSGNSYQGPTIPTTSSSSSPKVVEHETEVTKDTMPPTNNGSTKDVQPLVVQTETMMLNYDPVVAPVIEPVAALVSAPKPNQKPSILPASINLIPLSVWNKISLPELTPTLMTLELADRSSSRPIGVAKDVFVKVGKFQFPADFVVVDFDANPLVTQILGRSFLKTGRALIDVFEGEVTLRVGRESITFNLDQTSRYSANYNDMTANRIDVIDM
nr:reverse transcriptase domain-containing protein [Tanacetum cinerariifolium]